MGYTPRLSTAVWVGYPDAGIAMPGAQGGTYAAPVWHAFMLPASDGNCDDFPSRPRRSCPRPSSASTHWEQLRRRIRRRLLDGPHRVARRHRGGTDYDPNLYESALQQEPDVQVPPAQEELAPPAGGGTGAPDG